MAITGVDFTREFDRRVDKSYNDYYAPAVFKSFLRRSLQLSITEKYKNLDGQKRFDEIRSLLVYKKSIAATSGRILLQPMAVVAYDGVTGVITTAFPHNAQVGQSIAVNITGALGTFVANATVLSVTQYSITVSPVVVGAFTKGTIITEDSVTDYMHLFAVRAAYNMIGEDEIESIMCSPQRIVLMLTKRSKLRNGDKIVISGVNGASGANGTKYVNQVGTKRYQLYEDAQLMTASVAASPYISGGEIASVKENACFPIKPDMAHIQKVDTPSKLFPRYQIADNALILEPATDAQYVKMDYIKLPPFDIDPLDNNIDLLLYYTEEFIQYLLDFSARLFDLETKDANSLGMDTQQVVINQ